MATDANSLQTAKRNHSRGQAFIETALLLLAFLLVAAAFAFIAECTVASLKMQNTIRADAGRIALNSTAGVQSSNIVAWHKGSDGEPFTADDKKSTGVLRILAAFADNAFVTKKDEEIVEVPPLAEEFLVGDEKVRTSFQVSMPVMGF
ncbi:MAG: hypothetical protein IJ802_00950 [Kiritimatiellae bacterium]|nr:hypothetical protein [Kiritimatiellia bacterium]